MIDAQSVVRLAAILKFLRYLCSFIAYYLYAKKLDLCGHSLQPICNPADLYIFCANKLHWLFIILVLAFFLLLVLVLNLLSWLGFRGHCKRRLLSQSGLCNSLVFRFLQNYLVGQTVRGLLFTVSQTHIYCSLQFALVSTALCSDFHSVAFMQWLSHLVWSTLLMPFVPRPLNDFVRRKTSI